METLRLRLDSLRKAKNTTIVKREREPALVAISPKLGQRGLLLGREGEGKGKGKGRGEGMGKGRGGGEGRGKGIGGDGRGGEGRGGDG